MKLYCKNTKTYDKKNNFILKRNINDLKYEILNINNEKHLEMINYHINSPLILQYHQITNIGNKNVYDYIKQRDLFINNQNGYNTYHIVYLEINGEYTPIGMFMYVEYMDDINSATISYSISPQYQGLGFGSKIITMIEQHIKNNLPNIEKLYAYVFTSNIPSQKILSKNGFVSHAEKLYKPKKEISRDHDIKTLHNSISNYKNQEHGQAIVFIKKI